MKTIKLTSTEKKIDLLIQLAKEMGIEAKPVELTDEEMGLPGPKVSKEQLEAWLVKDDGDEGYTPAKLKQRISKRVSKVKRGKNGGNL